MTETTSRDDAYRTTRVRMIQLAAAADPGVPVPACPGWTVRELLSHVAGVAANILEGQLDGTGTDAWVEAQVRARAGRSIEEILAEWAELGPRLDELFEALGHPPRQLVFDTVTHEHDLRHALGQTEGRDEVATALALIWAARAWAGSSVEPGALRLMAGDIDVTNGDGVLTATVTLSPFEALRALTGRRTLDEILAYDWDGDPGPLIDRFTWGPFTPRPTPLSND